MAHLLSACLQFVSHVEVQNCQFVVLKCKAISIVKLFIIGDYAELSPDDNFVSALSAMCN